MKRNVTYIIAWAILAACFIALTVMEYFVNPTLFLVSLFLTIAVLMIVVIRIVSIRNTVTKLMTGLGNNSSTATQTVLSYMEMPALITDATNCVLWYNEKFKEIILDKEDILLENIQATIPEFDAVLGQTERGCPYDIGDQHYVAFSGSVAQGGNSLYITLFAQDTAQYKSATLYKKTRPSVLVCTIDNYDDLGSDSRESERSEIMTEVYRIMENFINSTNGIFARLSNRNFLAIIEEQHMQSVIENRFAILDEIRGIPTESIPATMSIGIGRGAKTLYENNILARQALDMALGRGGDQAAMKTRNGFEFFGGETRGVEKRNKVKARIVAFALADLMDNSANVVIMGHKNSDLDSLGSSMGLARMAVMRKKKVSVVLDSKTTMAYSYYKRLVKEGYGSIIVTPQESKELVNDKTLLIIVDCHVPTLTEEAEIIRKTSNVVLIDHHRKMVGFIENTVLSYHEPYSSSCSELVSELLQHLETVDEKANKIEAEGMLAGIMLDTKDFSVRTGVRTFEAASYLRRLGADTIEARLMFATDLETYKHKSELVSQAKNYRGCAVVITDKLPENMRVVVPQAADDLLNIEGISASIVAVKLQNLVHISSRSLGVYNVQLIMEYLGGGGHQTMAGVQMPDTSIEEIERLIHEAVDHYLDAKEKGKEQNEQ